jgi:hypothetical protein
MGRRGLAISLAVLGAQGFFPTSTASAGEAVARGVLAALATKEAVVSFIPRTIPACHPTGPDQEVCTWKLGSRQDRWDQLAGAVPTHERIHLVCFFPLAGGERAADSCTVFAAVRRLDGTPRSSDRNGPAWVKFREAQQARLDAAQTLVEMSTLMGSGPDLCVLLDPKRRRCQWRAGSSTPGYLVLRAIYGTRQRIRMNCTFPTDGGPREPDSCELYSGD